MAQVRTNVNERFAAGASRLSEAVYRTRRPLVITWPIVCGADYLFDGTLAMAKSHPRRPEDPPR